MSGIKQELTLLAALIAIVAIAYVWFIVAGAPRQTPAPIVQNTSQTKPIPPLTAAIEAQLQKNPTFQLFISYTDKGFEPAAATIKSGDTVRFTNNSSHDLWIAAIGTSVAPVYPGTSDCGASALDTCASLKPGDFWQFTFTQSGTWEYQNNLDKSDTASIKVK
jgi:plastocyanin